MTSDLLAHVLSMARAASPWIGPVLACAAFAEAMVVIGIFVPITPFLVLAGGVMGTSALDHGTPLWVSAGAFLGNAVSYQLGRRAAGAIATRLPAQSIALTERLFLRHGSAAIVIARFIGPPATIAPFLAGSVGLPGSRFLAASLVASLVWPFAMISVGLLGARLFH